MNVIKTTCAPADQQHNWDSIDWNKCEQEVRKLQVRLVKAQKEGRYNKVKALQWLLTHSFHAKALAVKRVTSNKGKRTSGVDHVLWSSSEAKYQAISGLKRSDYTPQPLKRVHIKKSNGKQRPLGIPTMKDRAMQALYLLALEPIAETTADSHSYGFRKERSTADARQMCFTALAKRVSAEWVLEADIKGCFDHISHDWLLTHIPMDRIVLKKWLKSGFIFNKELFLTDEGTPQGGIISPTLANMALDGLQDLLAEKIKRKRVSKTTCINPKVHLVRYADDFIITGKSKDQLETIVLPLVRDFLTERGLTLSEEKTRITHIEDGFDFLGFTIRKYEGKFLIKPSKEKLKKFSEKVAGIIDANKTSKQDSLIRLLNPVITGWANYYKGCNASDTFRKADYLIFQKLWAWALRRHPKKGKYWIANKYFRTIKNQSWRFAVDTAYKGKDDVFVLKKLYDTKIVRYVMIKQNANPFDPEWNAYFKRRETYKMLETFQGKKPVLYIWKRQKGVCPICGEIIGRELPWGTTDYLVNGLMQRTLVHDTCRRRNDQLKLKLS